MFIVFEGLDGSGKSTLIKFLDCELKNRGIPVVLTREPGGTVLAEKIRDLLLTTEGEVPLAKTELLLYQAGRCQHVEKVIRPALKKGHWVICDRYKASSLAFQVGGRGLDPKDVHWLNNFATQSLDADLTVLLDVSVEESKSRRTQRESDLQTSADRFEREKDEFHERVRKFYLNLAKTEGSWMVLDAQSSAEAMQSVLIDDLRRRGWLH